MTINKMTVRFKLPLLLLAATLAASNPALADGGEVRIQLCWALGKFDHTVYFAETDSREDRQASFVELLEISGVDPHRIECRISDSKSHRSTRAELMKSWSDSEFEIVNTTFLSDLDY